MNYLGICLVLFFSFTINAQTYTQNTSGFIGGYVSENNLPYWFYTNQNGRLDADTNILTLAAHESVIKLNENAKLEFGAGLLYQDGFSGDLQIDELFGRFTNSWLRATLGTKHPDELFDGLSSTNGNILWSGNTRAIPGLVLEASAPIKIFKGVSLDWGIGHYELGNDRFAEGARIHYKRLGTFINLNSKSRLHLELQHFVQWAGESEEFGQAPKGFSDFIDVFFC